jgi:monothiol glutaredoxin
LARRIDNLDKLLLQPKRARHHRPEAVPAVTHRQQRQRVVRARRLPATGDRPGRFQRRERPLEFVRNNENSACHRTEKGCLGNSLWQPVFAFEEIKMEKPNIIAYMKPSCGWSNGVRAVMQKYDLPFEDRDIINDPSQRQEMIQKTGQMLQPCVEVNGSMLADVSGEEVEAYLLANSLVENTDREAGAPTNQPCENEMSESEISFR